MTMSRSSSVSRWPCSDTAREARVLIAYAGDRLGCSIESSIPGSDRGSDGVRRIFNGFDCCEARTGTGYGVGDIDGVPHDGLRRWVSTRCRIEGNGGSGGGILTVLLRIASRLYTDENTNLGVSRDSGFKTKLNTVTNRLRTH